MLTPTPSPNPTSDAEDCGHLARYGGTCTSVTPTVGTTDFTLRGSNTTWSTSSTADDPTTPQATTSSGSAGSSGTTDPCGIRDCYAVSGPHSVTDFASFTPAAGIDHMQPNGWMVVGTSTNFFAVVDEPEQQGTLLGEPVSVRFVPSGYDWNYGDGTSASRTTKGAAWEAQGITDFDPTPTSHVFRTRGDYTIRLTIDFRIQYRLDGDDWIWATGELRVPANPLTATAGNAKTVLVSADCLTDPSGPGC